VSSVTLNDGTTSLLVMRTWVTGDPSSPDSHSSIVYLTPSSGAFAYAERHVFQSGGVDTMSLYSLDNVGTAVTTSTFNPATAASQNVDGMDGDAGTIVGDDGGDDSGDDASAFDGGAGDDSGDDAGDDAGDDGGQAISPPRANFHPGRRHFDTPAPTTVSASCALCADGLLALHYTGLIALTAVGTGAATAVCALVGIPTAEVGGVACHLIVAAVGFSASQIPSDAQGRANMCNSIDQDITLGAVPPICPAKLP
jgi:hypothetical protein